MGAQPGTYAAELSSVTDIPDVPEISGYGTPGKSERSIAALAAGCELAEKRYVSPFEIAATHFAFGLEDKGFEWLKRAFQDRCFELVSVKVDPRFDSIKLDGRFKALAVQLGLD